MMDIQSELIPLLDLPQNLAEIKSLFNKPPFTSYTILKPHSDSRRIFPVTWHILLHALYCSRRLACGSKEVYRACLAIHDK